MFLIKTETRTFRELLSNGVRYTVPPFQRDYAWEREQWDDLWRDIEDLLADTEPGHYLGYLVLQSKGHDQYDIIDGQQRLTTLSLLVLATLKLIEDLARGGHEADDNRLRARALRDQFIGGLDPVSLATTPKLTLNRASHVFFSEVLVPLRPVQTRSLNRAERGLASAFDDLHQKIRDHHKAQAPDGRAYAEFLQRISSRLVFTVITVDDELNAFRVFETLNARGVQLSPTDLIKNHLFATIHQAGQRDDLDLLERRWDKLLDTLKRERFVDFLRTHWNSRHDFTRHSDLFKAFRQRARDRQAAFELVAALEEDVHCFAARRLPEDELWSAEDRVRIEALNRFRVTQPWPLLLAVHRLKQPPVFSRVLRACVVISVRYNVVGRRAPAEQERTYAKVAQRVTAGELCSAREIIQALNPIYLSDEEFRGQFAQLALRTRDSRNRWVARYLLERIARQEGQPALELDRLTLEHILPEALPETGWAAFDPQEHARWSERLGNLTLLEASANRDLGQADYPVKIACFRASQIEQTRRIGDDHPTWDPKAVRTRQERLAKVATTVWRLDLLDPP